MIVKIKDGTYRVDVRGGGEMETCLFAPGPWYGGKHKMPDVSFHTTPDGWWGIDCDDFLKMAWLTICVLVRDKYWIIKRKIKKCTNIAMR